MILTLEQIQIIEDEIHFQKRNIFFDKLIPSLLIIHPMTIAQIIKSKCINTKDESYYGNLKIYRSLDIQELTVIVK